MKELFKGRAMEWFLFVAGIGLTVVFSTASLNAFVAERRSRQFDRPNVQTVAKAGSSADEPIIPAGTLGGTYLLKDRNSGPAHVIGRLSMPALGLAVPILSGIADADLTRGIGHIPGSGNAGGLGNMAVAGHRDTFFRPLWRVSVGMVAVVSNSEGNYRYQVDKTEIVTPEELKILEIGDRPQLTMITCYPFDFIGAAPKRFVVFAHLLSAAPDPVR